MTTPFVLEVQDQWGRTIRLTEDVWIGLVLDEHEELANQLNAVSRTLLAPDTVNFDALRSDGECFYRFGAVPPIPRRYLKVAVRFISIHGGTGYVSTAYISRNVPPKERLTWQK